MPARRTAKLVFPFLAAFLAAALFQASPAWGYVDLAPNLCKVIGDSRHIAVVEITAFDAEKHRIVLKEIQSLKGDLAADTVAHELVAADATIIPRPILQWAQPGARGVLFVAGDVALVCYGNGWYQAKALTPRAWKLSMERPDLSLAYDGTVSRLADAIPLMLAGKDAIITTLPHGFEEGASFDLALDRTAFPGAVKLQRMRANMKMPTVAMSVSDNAAYLIGPGTVDEKDLPELIEKLHAADASTRTDAANDIGSLGAKGSAAAAALTELLADKSPAPRMSAAAALLRIDPADANALSVLDHGLMAGDNASRRAAATAITVAGSGAAPLAPKLAALLKDSDEATRVAGLQAIDALGSAAAEDVDAVKMLLDDSAMALDAADALGRIGPAAQPVPPQIVKMLDSSQSAVRWTAVRAMAQIGGEASHPAVEFMIKALPKASEVDSYNMHIYLALLGPVARDAVPAINNAGLMNPVLPMATLWAIEPEKGFPWQLPARGRMALNGDDGPEFARFIYEAYVHELGPRLRPAAAMLAKEILAGTAGDVPGWGYKILNCDNEGSLAAFIPHLADKDLAMRERAAVALGYMGSAAVPATPALRAALAAASSDRERRLLAWSLRKSALRSAHFSYSGCVLVRR